jgi:hypothetical protein
MLHGALLGRRVEIAAVGRPVGTAAAAPNAARPKARRAGPGILRSRFGRIVGAGAGFVRPVYAVAGRGCSRKKRSISREASGPLGSV